MRNITIIIGILLWALVCETSRAEIVCQKDWKDSTVVEEFSIWYKCDSIDVNPDYLGNRSQITRIVRYIKNSPRIDSITIKSWSSPEGRYEHNKHLAQERAKAARRLLLSYSPDSIKLNAGKIKIQPMAENWDGFISVVKTEYNRPDRDAVLQILDDDRYHNDAKKWKIKCLNEGRSWRYMIDNYMPSLRAASWVCVWGEVMEPLEKLSCITSGAVWAEKGIDAVMPSGSPKTGGFHMAAKTNMLYDALLVPNAGLEFYLGKGFSIEANYMHAWWNSDPHNWYWRAYGADLGLRYWFGRAARKKPLTGHHIGAYGQVLTYDFELGNKGIIGGVPGGMLKDEPNYTAGIEYGYSVPIAKRLNIDFSIGLGYHWGVFYEYVPMDDCYVWQTTKMRNYIGPTKLGISLVWLIGKNNVNSSGKGGRR